MFFLSREVVCRWPPCLCVAMIAFALLGRLSPYSHGQGTCATQCLALSCYQSKNDNNYYQVDGGAVCNALFRSTAGCGNCVGVGVTPLTFHRMTTGTTVCAPIPATYHGQAKSCVSPLGDPIAGSCYMGCGPKGS